MTAGNDRRPTSRSRRLQTKSIAGTPPPPPTGEAWIDEIAEAWIDETTDPWIDET